jgi:glycosyltransferase involved in cell wall biosynthesis
MANKLTACVYTKNNDDVIEGALKSLSFVDELILLDSGSDDKTVELARPLVHRVEHRDWTGFCDQLNHITSLASHDWVLVLDADERLTPDLIAEIQKQLEDPQDIAYRLPRLTEYLGSWLHHGEFYPDHTIRLYKKGHGHYEGEPHAQFLPEGSVGTLKNPIQHFMFKHLGQQLATMNRYGQEHAQQMLAKGHQSMRLRSLIHSLQRFIKGYIFKAGFLDGWPGFVAAATASFNVFFKYVRVEDEANRQSKDHAQTP